VALYRGLTALGLEVTLVAICCENVAETVREGAYWRVTRTANKRWVEKWDFGTIQSVYVNSLTWKIVEVHSRITENDKTSLVFARSTEACLLTTLLYAYFSKLFVRFREIFAELPQYILDHITNHTIVKSSAMCTPNRMAQIYLRFGRYAIPSSSGYSSCSFLNYFTMK
jgi:hypothetical protein